MGAGSDIGSPVSGLGKTGSETRSRGEDSSLRRLCQHPDRRRGDTSFGDRPRVGVKRAPAFERPDLRVGDEAPDRWLAFGQSRRRSGWVLDASAQSVDARRLRSASARDRRALRGAMVNVGSGASLGWTPGERARGESLVNAAAHFGRSRSELDCACRGELRTSQDRGCREEPFVASRAPAGDGLRAGASTRPTEGPMARTCPTLGSSTGAPSRAEDRGRTTVANGS